jgi:hypothetical protein
MSMVCLLPGKDAGGVGGPENGGLGSRRERPSSWRCVLSVS